MRIKDLSFKNEFTRSAVGDEICEYGTHAKEIRAMIRKATDTEDFIDKFLACEDFIKMPLHEVIIKYERLERVWKFNRGVLGEDCFKTSSEMGGVKIGNDKFSLVVPNGRGDGTTRAAVKSKAAQEAKSYTHHCFNFFVSVEGEFNIYSSDCGNEVAITVNGRYGVFYYDGMVLFEEWN